MAQESKLYEALTIAAPESAARTTGWNMAVATCRPTALDGYSAGVAVVCRAAIGVPDPPGPYPYGVHALPTEL